MREGARGVLRVEITEREEREGGREGTERTDF
jgi:hypothetical protein